MVRQLGPMWWRLALILTVIVVLLVAIVASNWDDSTWECPQPKGKIVFCK